MALNFVGGVKNLTSSVTSLKKELSGVYDVLKKIKGIGPSAFGDVNAVLHNGGQLGNGIGNPLFTSKSSITNSKPSFGQNTVPASQPQSQAQTNNYAATGYMQAGVNAARFGVATGIAQTVAGVVGGAAAMTPDLGQILTRSSMFATTAATFGGLDRTKLQKQAYQAINGGQTSFTGSAEATAVLSQKYNYLPGSKGYTSAMGEVSMAAKSLNMDNAAAAAAVGGFATGRMGAQLYQYGIRQFDDKGEQRSTAAINKDVLQRVFYPGQDITKLSKKQLAKDMQYMGIEEQLGTMGYTEGQIGIAKAQWFQQIQGKSGEKLPTKGNKGAIDAMKQIASEEKLAQNIEKAMLKGFEKATEAVVAFNDALDDLPDKIYELKGALQGFQGSKVGGATVQTISSVAAGGASIIGNLLTLKYMKNFMKGGGAKEIVKETAKQSTKQAARTAATTAAANTAAAGGTTAAGTAGLAALPVTAGAALLYGQYQYNKKGQENLEGMERVASGNYSIPVKTEMRAFKDERPWWKKAGSWFNDQLSGIDGGPTAGFSSNFSSNAPSVNAFTFSSGAKPMAGGPVASSMGATSLSQVIGAGFGAKDLSMTTMSGAVNYHTGQDTPMLIGTPVYARFAGKVVEKNLSKDLGIAVEIDHGDGYSSIYGHLNLKVVRSGQDVKVGDLIGKSGATGRVKGPHLHFELRKGRVPINPKGYDPFVPENQKSDGKKGTASSAAGAAVGPANVSKGVRASGKELHAWLMSKGLSSNGATGVLGNLIQESGLRTGAIGDGGTSFGIAQWHKGRGDNLKKFAAEKGLAYTDIELQKMFLWKEMQGYPGMVKALKDPNIGLVDAAALFMRKFERPKDQSDTAANKRASLGIGAMQGGTTSGFNTDVPVAASKNDAALAGTSSNGSLGNQSSGTKNVYVTLQINQANEHEAIAFAKKIKTYIEQDNNLTTMGSK